jgi:cytochrome c553
MKSIWIAPLIAGAALAGEADSPQVAFFEKKVRPILVSHCYNCHSADTKPAGGLRVDDRNGLLTGGNSGPAIIPGEPEKSLILERIRHKDPKKRMPKEGGELTEAEIADLSLWIRDGVAWPAEKLPDSFGKSAAAYEKLRARHWAWQPVTETKPPVVTNSKWPRSDMDRFILAKLEEKKLSPVADADRLTLIRRVTFDLTGLPPTPAEIDSFLKDKSPNAYAALVDRLLASPRFGERWGRHWLDVARYGESTGPSRNIPYPHAWKYRDYVLDSANRDVPFNRFIQEQVAGDLLPAATPAERDRLVIATGLLALGPKDVNQRFKERFQMDNVDEQIDTLSRSVLAMTVSCARCHDHKFDPIPSSDYYALAGIFTSTDQLAGVRSKMGGAGLEYYNYKMLAKLGPDLPNADPERVKTLTAEIAVAQQKWDAIRGTPEGLKPAADGKPTQRPYRLKLEALQQELLQLVDPAEHGYAAHGLREGKIADTAIRIRGQAERLGPTVPRGFPTTFAVPGAPAVSPSQSGRLELAQWLTSEQNPLTARVIVNRAWQHLFGQGIVTTVDNFGVTGDRPSHPELLDYLARQFVRDGWSIKKLVRDIALSRSYQLNSSAPAGYREIDPANRLVWRHSPRRLDAEEMRDAMLIAAGRLELAPMAGSPAKSLKMIEMPDNGPESRKMLQTADDSTHRSVYLPLLRGVIPTALEAFDPVTQTLVTGQRDSTTVPTQALYLLNSKFVREQSRAFAEKLLAEPGSPAARIRWAYRLTVGRFPTPQELDRAQTFLGVYETTYGQSGTAQSVLAKAEQPKALTDRVDQADQTDAERNAQAGTDGVVQAKSSQEAAWMSFVQALYGSAEFRFVR